MRLPKAPSWPHWGTPPEIVRLLEAFGPIRLDPCWNEQSPIRPEWAYTGTAVYHKGVQVEGSGNGLVVWWHGSWWTTLGYVYVNPPYGPGDMRRWSEKIALEAGMGVEIVVLVAKRASAKWYQTLMRAKPAVVLDIGPKRIQFVNPPPPRCAQCGEDRDDENHWEPASGRHPFVAKATKDNSSVESVMFYYGTRVREFVGVFGDRGYAMAPIKVDHAAFFR